MTLCTTSFCLYYRPLGTTPGKKCNQIRIDSLSTRHAFVSRPRRRITLTSCANPSLKSSSLPSKSSAASRFALNAGAWEGNLSSYNARDGALLTRQPTILFVQPEFTTLKDSSTPVAAMSLALRRPRGGRDTLQYYTSRDLASIHSSGMVFFANGSFCSGSRSISPDANMVVIEQNINATISKASCIGARARLVTIYQSCGGLPELSKLSLFRERPSSALADADAIQAERMRVPSTTEVPPDVIDSDTVGVDSLNLEPCESMQAHFELLRGTWNGSGEIVRGDGTCSAAPQYEMRVGTMDIDTLDVPVSIESDSFGVVMNTTAKITSKQTAIFSDFAGRSKQMTLLGESGRVTSLAPQSTDLGGGNSGGLAFEMAWMPGNDLRFRIARVYNADGKWIESRFFSESRIS